MQNSIDVIILGSSGFIGNHLLNAMKNTSYNLRLLMRKIPENLIDPHFKVIQGNILDKNALVDLITENSIVINLVYLSNSSNEENLLAGSNLVEACLFKKAKKLIHCSTAVVCGRQMSDLITEETPCHPFNEYEKNKLEIENLLLEKGKNSELEIIIVRPTAVFGTHGKNLLSLANSLLNGNKFVNYIRSSLYDRRTMNLVAVHNVVSALVFLTNYPENLNRQIFIISDDSDPSNNYRTIEKDLMKYFGINDYFLPRATCISVFLGPLLKITNRSNTNPNRIFLSDKLLRLGWKPEYRLVNELRDFSKSLKN